jgi:predicted RecB family nuclease
VLFCAASRVRALDRQQLATRAVLLARIQGTLPSGGTVYLGRSGARTSIRFGSNLTTAENILRDAERLQRAEVPPKLLLNDRCRICPFRDRCRDQAIREDNLSLLRGVGEKAIKRYARQVILTLTQLAHTFRPRRRGERADTALTRRDHALHALAIRDRTIYVLGGPTIPTATARIYVDMEGDPEGSFIYLIGLVVCEGERVERYSFWADDAKGEAEIFNRFFDVVAQHTATTSEPLLRACDVRPGVRSPLMPLAVPRLHTIPAAGDDEQAGASCQQASSAGGIGIIGVKTWKSSDIRTMSAFCDSGY